MFVSNSCAIVLMTIVWTWIFNNARGSIMIATLVHALSNGNAAYVSPLLTLPEDPWGGAAFLGVLTLAIVVATRGRLGYEPPAPALS